MQLFDTHCHLTDERFSQDLDAVIDRMKAAGVQLAVVIGDAASDPTGAIELAKAHSFLFSALGVHPHDASEWNEDRAAKVFQWLTNEKVMALGEIGLDYHYDLSPRDMQIEAFEAQLDMAHQMNLPAILHIREAHGEATEILTRRHKNKTLPQCLMHCYTGSWESAKTYLSMGMYISLSGAVTFKNAPKLAEVAINTPIDRLMVETDCPYMAPVPMRGKRNEPAFVAYTAQKIAQLRDMDEETFAAAAFENGKRFYRIK